MSNFNSQLPPVRSGERPSAAQENILRELVVRVPDGFEQDGSNLRQAARSNSIAIGLYEVTAAPEQDTDSKEWFIKGKRVSTQWCTVDGSGHFSAAANSGDTGAVARQRINAADREVDIWVPSQSRDANGEPTSAPSYAVLDRVYVTMWSGLRVVLAGAGGGGQYGILDGDLVYNGTATVSIWTGVNSSATDTTVNITDCWTWLLTTGKKLAAGSQVELIGNRIIASRECPIDI